MVAPDITTDEELDRQLRILFNERYTEESSRVNWRMFHRFAQADIMDINQASIRNATEEDLEDIMEIERKCFPGPIAYSKSQLRYLLLRANSASFVEVCGNVIRGFVIAAYREGSSIGHIETIDVDPAYAKLGIGLKLLTHAEDDMRRRGKKWSLLEVSEGNRPALYLYKKAGYVVKDRIKKYYRYEHAGTRDALRMIKAL